MYNAEPNRVERFQNVLIKIIGETVEERDTKVRRMAARQIIKRDQIFNAICDPDALMVEIGDLTDRLANPWANFAAELREEREPYAAEGISFSSLVHLVRVEDDLFAWGWLPERLRELGLEMNFDEELAWPITRDWLTIKGREGNLRRFYRHST